MKSRPISIVSMVCGILSVPAFFVNVMGTFGSVGASAEQYAKTGEAPAPVAAVIIAVFFLALALAGIVLGAMGIKMSAAEGRSKGFAVAGLVCGIIGTFFALIGVACTVFICANWNSMVTEATNQVTSSALSSAYSELSSVFS